MEIRRLKIIKCTLETKLIKVTEVCYIDDMIVLTKIGIF